MIRRLMTASVFGICATALSLASTAEERGPIIIYAGYMTQIHCKGRLYLSSVGDTKLVNREPFPKDLGCGVLIQPLSESGRTDLLLKTSIGDSHRILEIKKAENTLAAAQLEIWLEPDPIPRPLPREGTR